MSKNEDSAPNSEDEVITEISIANESSHSKAGLYKGGNESEVDSAPPKGTAAIDQNGPTSEAAYSESNNEDSNKSMTYEGTIEKILSEVDDISDLKTINRIGVPLNPFATVGSIQDFNDSIYNTRTASRRRVFTSPLNSGVGAQAQENSSSHVSNNSDIDNGDQSMEATPTLSGSMASNSPATAISKNTNSIYMCVYASLRSFYL